MSRPRAPRRAASPVVTSALLAALLLGACGDDTAETEPQGDATTSTGAPATTAATTPPGSTTTTEAPAPDDAVCASPGEVPTLIVAGGTDVMMVEDGQQRTLTSFDDEVWLAFSDGADLVVASTRVGTGPGSRSQGWIVEGGEPREIVEEGSPGVLVYELTEVDGAPVVIYGPILDVESPGAADSTPVVAARVDGTDRWGLGDAFAPEWAVVSASAAAGFVMFTAVSDLTESVFTTSVRGPLVSDDRFEPEPPYAAPPLVTSAVLHPDGAALAWVEGPDWDEASQASTDAPWQLVVADAETGEERFRRSVLTSVEAVLHVEWDGDVAVVSRFGEPPLLVDTADAGAPLVEVCGVSGVATLPRPRG